MIKHQALSSYLLNPYFCLAEYTSSSEQTQLLCDLAVGAISKCVTKRTKRGPPLTRDVTATDYFWIALWDAHPSMEFWGAAGD